MGTVISTTRVGIRHSKRLYVEQAKKLSVKSVYQDYELQNQM